MLGRTWAGGTPRPSATQRATEARSAGEVREKVTRNLHNKNYYGDTSELYNVAHGHFTQQQAVARARQN